MNRPLRLTLVLGLLILVSLVLAACEKERPIPSQAAPTSAPARSTVASSPAPATTRTPGSQTGTAAPLAATGTASAQAPGATASPTPPAARTVAVTPGTQPAGTQGASFTYLVVAGDTLAAIATRFGTTQDAIATLNGLADPNALAIGQQLKIPGAQPSGSAATPGSGKTSIYVVQGGDTLKAIAGRFGTTVDELMRLNSITNPDLITIGQKLVVPGSTGSSTTTQGTPGGRQKYVVQAGDTLASIARRFGVTIQSLQTANGISNPDLIYPGQTLTIP
jgi:LysM repeat protein